MFNQKNRVFNQKIGTFYNNGFENTDSSLVEPTKVAIIIPIYNDEKYLKECLDSCINQTLQNIQIICINDGSTDGSQNILEEYLNKNPHKIKIFQQENAGSGPARNFGLSEADLCGAKFVSFMDSDDYYPDKFVLEILYETAKRNKSILCGGNMNIVTSTESETITKEQKDLLHKRQQRTIRNAITFETEDEIKEYKSSFLYQRFLFDRKFLKENGILFPAYRRFQDPVFLAQVLAHKPKIHTIPKNVYCYRINYKATHSTFKIYNGILEAMRDCVNIFLKNNMPNHLLQMVKEMDDQKTKINKIKKLKKGKN
jgi:glycosyltransferase involved in cell wall biosynthesis